MPKYRIGKDPGLQPNDSMYTLSAFVVLRFSKAEDFTLMEINFEAR